MNRRSLVAATAAVAGGTSIALTAVSRWSPVQAVTERGAFAWLLIEPFVLILLVFIVVRWVNPRAAVVTGTLTALGSALWVQRFIPDESLLGAVGSSAVWLVPSVAAGSMAWYLRWANAQKARAVTAATMEQRRQLAVDLHDYVAHDISEILAWAQAGTAVLPPTESRALDLLKEIEAAGLRALESMDRTVHTLAEDEQPARIARGGIDDIGALAERFGAANRVKVIVSKQLTRDVDPRIGTEAYRAVVEALTNIRRHAHRVERVEVELSNSHEQVHVTVLDDGFGATRPAHQRTGGIGLAAMGERIAALGGAMETQRMRPNGWRLTVTLPLTRPTEQETTP